MNKLFSLALASLASIAFLSCSDEKSSAPSHAELCAGGVSEACLIGRWSLDGIKELGANSCDGILNIEANKFKIIEGSCGSYSDYSDDLEAVAGTWKLNGSEITATCTTCNYDEWKGDVTLISGGATIEIKSKGNVGVITQYSSGQVQNPTEVWKFLN